ncbi:MAG: formylglycine-generating enzyme family protein [Bacillota bacterium]
MKGAILTVVAMATWVGMAWGEGPAKGLEIQEILIPKSTVSFKVVKLPAGSIEMPAVGEATAKKVEVKGLWMGQTELTWEAYDQFCLGLDFENGMDWNKAIELKTRPSKVYGVLPDYGWGHEAFAAMSITANSAQMYCKWLSEKTGKKFRLPTEAEWEYAARAGDTREELDIEELKTVAWFAENAKNEELDELTTHKVGSKKANAWGLYDMLGNVAEWVMGMDEKPVVKGGTYRGSEKQLRYRWRTGYSASWQMRDPQIPKSQWWLSDGPHVGFRVVMEE